MSRSLLNNSKETVESTDRSVLFSFVQGEQLEQAIALQFLPDAFSGYTFEAVVIEADNVADQTQPPTKAKTGGMQHILPVRVPTMRGAWNSASTYNNEDVVSYGGNYYRLQAANGYISGVNVASDINWALTVRNSIYVQFLKTVGLGWTVQPEASCPTYGFFELRITEPSSGQLQRTWKPLRGSVELLYSPLA